MFFEDTSRTSAQCGHCGRKKAIEAYISKPGAGPDQPPMPVCADCTPGVTMIYAIVETNRLLQIARQEEFLRQMGHS